MRKFYRLKGELEEEVMKNIEVKAIVFSAILIGIIFMVNAVYPVQLEVSPAAVQAAPEHTAAGST
jgi:hypothetical protein